MTGEEYAKRVAATMLSGKHPVEATQQYISDLFNDIGKRYPINDFSLPVIYAVFRTFADTLLADADNDAKAACESLYKTIQASDKKVIKIARPQKGGK